MIRFGIIGTGSIATKFAADIQYVDSAVAHAVAARDSQRLQKFASVHGVRVQHRTPAELVEDPEVDVVYISTPNHCHLEHARLAMDAGKAVLCEKPLCRDFEETQALIEYAQSKGVYLMEALWTWCLPAIKRAHQWLQCGEIGELKHIEAGFGVQIPFSDAGRHWDPAQGGGCLLDLGIYPIALTRLLVDREPEQVFAIASDAATGVEEDAAVLMDFGGVQARLGASFTTVLPNMAHVVGTEGRIEIPDFWRATECRLLRGRSGEVVEHYRDPRAGSGLEYQIRQVCADLEAGLASPSLVRHEHTLAFQRDLTRIRVAMAAQ
jgi:predicted dehydrogenase